MMSEQPISGKLRFDPVVTWGHVMITVGFIVSGIGVYVTNELRANDLAYRISTLEMLAAETKQANRDLLNELKSLNKELVDIRIKMGPRQQYRGPAE
jgi:hypothetical protein